MEDNGLLERIALFFFLRLFRRFDFGNVGENQGALIFFTYDMEAAGFPKEGEKTLVYIDEADLVPPLVVDEEFFPLFGRHAHPRIEDVDFVVLGVLYEAHLYFSSLRPLEDAVDDRVFYEGLQQQRWYLYGIQLIFWKIVGNFQAVPEAGPFQFRIAFNDVKFFGQGNELGRVIEAVPEIIGQVLDKLPRRIGVTPDVVADGIQGVIEEVGVDLGLEGSDFCLRQQVLLFLHLVVFVDGFHDVADTVEELDAHFCEGIPFALGGDDVAHRFMVVGYREGHEVGHVGQLFLQLQYGNFRFPLVFVRLISVIGMDIEMVLVGNGGPCEVWQGGSNQFRNAGDVRIVESVMEGAEEAGHRIEGGAGGLGLFGVPLVDEEFNDHVEQAHCNGIGDDDGKGQAEISLRVLKGFRKGKERIEQPEQELQHQGIHEGPQPELVMVAFEAL